tara:strand:- start:418 stop:1113 length:696 start_codon:yes stop_codon:yes gene_type:complete
VPERIEIQGDQKNITVFGFSAPWVVVLIAVILAGIVGVIIAVGNIGSDDAEILIAQQPAVSPPVVITKEVLSPSATPALMPTTTPASKPALDGLAKFSTFNYETDTFEIFMEIPSSFRRENIERGARFYGSQADITFTYYDHPSDEIDELVESLFTEQFAMGYDVPWVEEARAKQDGIIVSTGSLGRAFRRNILMPSSDSTVTMIAFTANPDYLDQHVDLFMRIRNSINFK